MKSLVPLELHNSLFFLWMENQVNEYTMGNSWAISRRCPVFTHEQLYHLHSWNVYLLATGESSCRCRNHVSHASLSCQPMVISLWKARTCHLLLDPLQSQMDFKSSSCETMWALTPLISKMISNRLFYYSLIKCCWQQLALKKRPNTKCLLHSHLKSDICSRKGNKNHMLAKQHTVT